MAKPANRPPTAAIEAAAIHGVDLTGHRAQLLTRELAQTHDLIVAMEASQVEDLHSAFPDLVGRVALLPLYDRAPGRGFERFHIADPFGGPPSLFESCYRRIDQALSGLFEALELRLMAQREGAAHRTTIVDCVPERVLCVDLDGTVIATDMLWESFVSAVRHHPWVLAIIPMWLLSGRAYLKSRLAEAARIDFTTLPYRTAVVAYVENEHRRGRRVVLATASDERLAAGVSAHLGCFTDVLGSNQKANLKGPAKAASLVRRFGAGNYDYIGDSRADVACWAQAADAVTVGAFPSNRVSHLRHLPAMPANPSTRQLLLLVLKALRPHQWMKNVLLVVPAVAGHRLDWPVVIDLVVAFACLSLCASGGYILNDLLDLGSDRCHPRKRRRPFAAGLLPLPAGFALVAGTWLVGFGLAAWLLPPAFSVILAVYLAGTAAYSLHIKKQAVLDVIFLAGLYVLRVVAGGVAVDVQPSTWLLTFTLFVCLSLAFLKRFTEAESESSKSAAIVNGRGYLPDDAAWLQSAGLAAAYLSVVVLAIYVNSDDVRALYSHPERLLLMCPVLLYWATKVWLDAHRHRIHEDPLVAVAKDRTTYVLAIVSSLIVYAGV